MSYIFLQKWHWRVKNTLVVNLCYQWTHQTSFVERGTLWLILTQFELPTLTQFELPTLALYSQMPFILTQA